MVLELHKAGYQHLRIVPGHSLRDGHWRVWLLPVSCLHNDGWTPVSFKGSLFYSTEYSEQFFGITHTGSDNARALAVKLLKHFPELGRDSSGRDWMYSGWLVEMLGRAEHGQLPALFGSHAFDHGLAETPYPPPPPPGLRSKDYIGTGYRIISHSELALIDLPPPAASYEDLWEFCLSFDAGRAAHLADVELSQVAEDTKTSWASASIEALRMTAFYYQRAIKWGDLWPPSDDYVYFIRRAVEEIRSRLVSKSQLVIPSSDG
jgi:hypothetical protein